MDEVKKYVVCMRKERCSEPHPDSTLRRCDTCHTEVWCMPFNLLNIPLCMQCAMELPDAKFINNRENLDAAIAEIRRRKIG